MLPCPDWAVLHTIQFHHSHMLSLRCPALFCLSLCFTQFVCICLCSARFYAAPVFFCEQHFLREKIAMRQTVLCFFNVFLSDPLCVFACVMLDCVLLLLCVQLVTAAPLLISEFCLVSACVFQMVPYLCWCWRRFFLVFSCACCVPTQLQSYLQSNLCALLVFTYNWSLPGVCCWYRAYHPSLPEKNSQKK